MPAIRIIDFDTWNPGYGFATVLVLQAGTELLADIFYDEALAEEAPNPQTCLEKTQDGISYGKFARPIYCGVPFELRINTIDQTGVQRPAIVSLDGEDASKALVTVAGGTEEVELEDHLARRVDVRDFGEFKAVGVTGASAATNNASLASAIGVVGAMGGGYVEVPAGTYQFTNLTIPQGVVVRGAGRVATTLQSTQANNVITIGGVRCGFTRLTLDGVSKVATSVGVYAVNKDYPVFNDVEIKRFETGLYRKGGTGGFWRELFISDCTSGYKGHGDLAATLGAALLFNEWLGGKVELCSDVGVELKNVDAQSAHSAFRYVTFDTNTGVAVRLIGSRNSQFDKCRWIGNTADFDVKDNTPLTPDNSIIGLLVNGGSIEGGTMTFKDTLENVVFRRVDLKDVAITLTTPQSNIVAEDCREISGVTFAGVGTCWVRSKTTDRGASAGITTGAAATKIWEVPLDPGQRVYLIGVVVARQRNAANSDAFYHIGVSARRPAATLGYDSQTANFAAGNVVTGATSGATARIVADSDSGTTGTLSLQDIVGTFVDNEIITDSGGGSATVNGSLATSGAALVGTVASIRAAQEVNAAWDATFAANGNAIELQVTGEASKTIEWIGDVKVVSS
jgi:hypothetical protein